MATTKSTRIHIAFSFWILALIACGMFASGCVSGTQFKHPPVDACTVTVPFDRSENVHWTHECDDEHFAAIAEAVASDLCHSDADCAALYEGEY